MFCLSRNKNNRPFKTYVKSLKVGEEQTIIGEKRGVPAYMRIGTGADVIRGVTKNKSSFFGT